MKKFLSLLLIIVMCISLVACNGEKTENNNASDDNTSYSENKEEPEIIEDNGVKVEKSIDAVAEALGLTDGEKNFYDIIGAIDGKEYNNGSVELYQYDESSEKYQAILDGKGSSKIAAYKNGIVLLFPVGTKPDAELIKAFNELNIED